MFSRIWAFILSILISIFPGLGGNTQPKLDWEAAALVVLDAIKTRDIDAIEAFMCKNIKDNNPDLHDKIGAFIDAIEGEIVSLTKSPANGSGTYTSNGKIEKKISAWDIETTEASYSLTIRWEISNNYSFEERGIRAFGLMKKTDGGWISCGVGIAAFEYN